MRICLHLNKTEQYYKTENKISMTNENDGLIGCLLMLTKADQSLYSLFVFKNICSLFSLCHKEWPLLLHSAQVTLVCGKTVNLRPILLPMGCCTQSGQLYGGTVAKCPPSASWSGARPTKHISIEFEIRWKFKTLYCKIYAADHNDILHTSLSWRVQNIVVIGRVHSKLEHSEFSSNFEFDRNMLSGTGAWCAHGKNHRRHTVVKHV